MEKNDGGSAFPCAGSEHGYPVPGMTLRDYFAAKALQGIISNEALIQRIIDSKGRPSLEAKFVAETAYMAADSMLAAREAAE